MSVGSFSPIGPEVPVFQRSSQDYRIKGAAYRIARPPGYACEEMFASQRRLTVADSGFYIDFRLEAATPLVSPFPSVPSRATLSPIQNRRPIAFTA